EFAGLAALERRPGMPSEPGRHPPVEEEIAAAEAAALAELAGLRTRPRGSRRARGRFREAGLSEALERAELDLESVEGIGAVGLEGAPVARDSGVEACDADAGVFAAEVDDLTPEDIALEDVALEDVAPDEGVADAGDDREMDLDE